MPFSDLDNTVDNSLSATYSKETEDSRSTQVKAGTFRTPHNSSDKFEETRLSPSRVIASLSNVENADNKGVCFSVFQQPVVNDIAITEFANADRPEYDIDSRTIPPMDTYSARLP